MGDKTLDDIQTMLNSYSFKFTLCDARSAESIDGSTKYVAYCGVLRDAREFIFETKRLKNIQNCRKSSVMNARIMAVLSVAG